MNPQLVPAREEDLPALAKLAEKIWRSHYSSIISPEQINYMLKNFNSVNPFRQQLREGQRIHLVKLEDTLIGYLAESNENEREFFLHKFYIDPDFQGKGLGKKIFREVFSQYPDLSIIRLTVNRKNYKSINFYFRLGFVIEKVADFDIGKGYFMNDFVMIRR